MEHARELAAAVEHSPAAVIITDREGLIRFVNPRFTELTGYSRSEAVGRKPSFLKSGRTRPEEYARLWEDILAGKVWRGEFHNRKKNGELYWEAACIAPIRGPDGTIERFVAVKEDITALKEASAALASREEQFRRLVEGLSREYFFYRHGADGVFTYLSPSIAAILGYTREEFLTHYTEYLTDDPCNMEVQRRTDASLAGIQQPAYPVSILHKDGSVRRLDVLETPIRDGSGRVIAVEGIARDVTEAHRAALELRESEERYRELVETLDDPVHVLGADGRLLYANRAWRRALGYGSEPLDAVGFDDILHPDHLAACRALWERISRAPAYERTRSVLIAKDGTPVPIEARILSQFSQGRLVSVRCVCRDLRLEERLERETARAAALESLGIFAGGVAHDFNNFLTAVLGNVALLRDPGLPASERERLSAEAEEACLRARGLSGQLLTFAKGGVPAKKPVRLRELAEQTARLIAAGSSMRLEFLGEERPAPVQADPAQIGQVLANLIMNAKQAMGGGGLLRLTFADAALEPVEAAAKPPLAPGPHVLLQVEDQGPGIPPGNLARIFDPYFTTKAQGSGLGLSVCWSIIRRHGGRIEADCAPGGGALFRIWLPASTAPDPEPSEAPPAAPLRPSPAAAGILVMDDEEQLLRLALRVLRAEGYEAVGARDGEEAVRLYREAREAGRPFAGVVLDLTVRGGTGGREALKALRRLDPAVRAVVSSGYSDEGTEADFRGHGFSACLPKPYRPAELVLVVGRLLAAPPAQG